MLNARKGFVVGASLGIVILLALLIGMSILDAPTGTGDRVEWFMTYSLLLGMPTSYLISGLTQAAAIKAGAAVWFVYGVALIVNWTLIGGALGLLASRLRRAP